ncbi:hypothetical protein D9M71_487770 [compost metagenome]
MDGPATDPGGELPQAERRGALAPDAVAFLAQAAAQGADQHLLRQLVQPAAACTGLRRHRRGHPGRRRRGGGALRADALRRGRAALQVLVPPVEEAAQDPPEGAGEGPGAPLAAQRTGLEAERDLRPVRALRRAPAAPHQPRLCAVVRGRGRGPALSQPDRRPHPAGGAAGGARHAGEEPRAPGARRAAGGQPGQSRADRQPRPEQDAGQGCLQAATGP